MMSKGPRISSVLVLLATATVALGIWGRCLGSDCPSTGGAIDALLQSTAYLVLDGFDPLPSGPGAWLERTARILAVLFILLGVAAIVERLSHWLGRIRFRTQFLLPWSGQSIDLVCGLGESALRLLDGCASHGSGRGAGLIAIAGNRLDAAAAAFLEQRVPVLFASPSSPAAYSSVNFRKIRRIFIAANSDAEALDILSALTSATKSHLGNVGRRSIPCILFQDDEEKFRSLISALPADHALEVRVTCRSALIAREHYAAHYFDRFQGSEDSPRESAHGGGSEEKASAPISGAHGVFIGEGELLEELILQAIRTNVFEPSKRFTVDVFSNGGGRASAERWKERFPCYSSGSGSPDNTSECVTVSPDEVWISEGVLPPIRFSTLPRSRRGLVQRIEECCQLSGSQVLTFVIATPEPIHGLEIALQTAKILDAKDCGVDAEIWVYLGCSTADLSVAQKSALDDKSRIRPGAPAIRLIEDISGASLRNALESAGTEGAAKRLNWIFNNTSELGPDRKISTTLAFDKSGSEEAWKNTSESHKNSSRHSAMHAYVKRRIAVRCDFRAEAELLGLGDEFKRKVASDRDWLMAAIEHRRWCAEQLLSGMRPLLDSSATDKLICSADNRRLADDWYQGNKGKMQAQYKHLTLLPNARLLELDEITGVLKLESELAKDLTIAKNLDFILDGRQ